MVLFCAEVGAGAYAVKHGKQVRSLLRSAWDSDTDSEIKYIQDHFHCCGFDETSGASKVACPAQSNGYCFPALQAAVKKDMKTIAIVAYCAAGFQILTLVVAIVLIMGIRNTDRDGYSQLDDAYLLSGYLPPGQVAYSTPTSEMYPQLRKELNPRK